MSTDLRVNDSALIYKNKKNGKQWFGEFRPHSDTVRWARAIIRLRREKRDGSAHSRALYIVRVKALK